LASPWSSAPSTDTAADVPLTVGKAAHAGVATVGAALLRVTWSNVAIDSSLLSRPSVTKRPTSTAAAMGTSADASSTQLVPSAERKPVRRSPARTRRTQEGKPSVRVVWPPPVVMDVRHWKSALGKSGGEKGFGGGLGASDMTARRARSLLLSRIMTPAEPADWSRLVTRAVIEPSPTSG